MNGITMCIIDDVKAVIEGIIKKFNGRSTA